MATSRDRTQHVWKLYIPGEREFVPVKRCDQARSYIPNVVKYQWDKKSANEVTNEGVQTAGCYHLYCATCALVF